MATVLLADDDPFLLQIYSTRLQKDGYEVIGCSDGQVALEKIKEVKPDLVVLDIMLPKLSGLDILSAVRADKKMANIPIVMLSNLTHAEEQEEAKRRGATAFLAKIQLTPSQVVAQLQNYLPKPSIKSADDKNDSPVDKVKKSN